MRSLALLMMAVAVSACARVPAHRSVDGPRFNANVLTWQEMSNTPYRDLLSAVQQLRPAFLNPRDSRGLGQIATYVDGVRVDGARFLSAVSVASVAEVRRINGIDATTRYGAGHSSGAILITTQRGFTPR